MKFVSSMIVALAGVEARRVFVPNMFVQTEQDEPAAPVPASTEDAAEDAAFAPPAMNEPNHIDAILKEVNNNYNDYWKSVEAEKAAWLEGMRKEVAATVGYHNQRKQWKETGTTYLQTEAEVAYDEMDFDEMNVALESTLDSALESESRGDADAAVAKTAAIKNIQKALTARILKRLDDGQPLVEVARKMKAIEGMQPQINDMERRLGIMQSVEPVLENAIKTLQKVVDVRGMGKK